MARGNSAAPAAGNAATEVANRARADRRLINMARTYRRSGAVDGPFGEVSGIFRHSFGTGGPHFAMLRPLQGKPHETIVAPRRPLRLHRLLAVDAGACRRHHGLERQGG